MPLFWPNRDYEVLAERINRELIDKVIDTWVTIYRISASETEINLYGESAISTGKIFEPGVLLPALIDHENITFETNQFGPSAQQDVKFAFQRHMLIEKSFRPEIGDMVEWNYAYFEINSIDENKLIGGDIEKNLDIVVSAHLTKYSTLNIGQDTYEAGIGYWVIGENFVVS